MSHNSAGNSAVLPNPLPAGSTYVVENRGSMQDVMLVDRYVRLPDGRRVELAARLIPCVARVASVNTQQLAAGLPERRCKTRSEPRQAK
jgi:hypothetical protein